MSSSEQRLFQMLTLTNRLLVMRWRTLGPACSSWCFGFMVASILTKDLCGAWLPWAVFLVVAAVGAVTHAKHRKEYSAVQRSILELANAGPIPGLVVEEFRPGTATESN